MEVLNQLIIAKELDYVSQESYISIRIQIEKVANKLNALRNSQLKD